MTTDQQSTIEASTPRAVEAIEFRIWRPGTPVRRLRLAGARYTLGSSSGCSIRLDDPTLRPMHAVILRDPDRTLLRAYSVPVEVNGRRTTEAILEPGDLFTLGQYQFEYVRPHAAVPDGASQRTDTWVPPSANAATSPPAGQAGPLQVPRRVSFASGMRLPAEAPRPPAPAASAASAADPLARHREQQYERQLADVLARFAQTQQRADQADQSIDLMRQQIDQLAKQLAGAAEMAQRYQDEQEVLRQAKQQAHVERAAALHQRDQAIQQQQEAGRQRDDARSAAQTAESDAQHARERCEQLTQQHATAIQQVEQLTQRFEDASAQLEQASERCRRLSEQCDQITAEQERIVAQRDQIAADRDRAIDQRDRAVEQHDRMRQQHGAVCQERISLAEERDELAASRQRLTDDCERIAQERDRIADLLSEMQQQRDQAATTAQQYLEELADLQTETERLEQQIARLEALVQQSDAARQQDRRSWEAEAAELRETIQSVSGELATTAAQLAQSREAADALSGQLQEARDALATAEAQVLDARADIRDARAEAAAASRRAADAQGRATTAEARASDAQASAMAAEARARDAEARGTTDAAAAKQAADAELLAVQQRLAETETQLEQLRRDYDARPVAQPHAPSDVVPLADAELPSPDAEYQADADQDESQLAWMPPSPWAIPTDVEAADEDDAPQWNDPHPWAGPTAAAASADDTEAEDEQPADAVSWQPPQGLEEEDQLARRLREQLEAQSRREPEDQPAHEPASDDWGHTCVMPADSLRTLEPAQDDEPSLPQWTSAADADDDAADTDVREYLSGSLTHRSAEDGTVPGAAAESDDGDLRPAWAVAADEEPPATDDEPLLTADAGAWNQRPAELEGLIEAPLEAPEAEEQTQWTETSAEPMPQGVDRLDDHRGTCSVGDVVEAEAEADTADEDDSIEAYMNRLLQRVQGRGGKTSTSESATRWTPASAPAPVAAPVAADSRPASGPQSSSQRASGTTSDTALRGTAGAESGPTSDATTAGAADHKPFVPRSTAPERNSNLAAMRELANSSARTAIQRSVRQRAQTTVLAKFAQAAASVSVGTVLWITSQLQFGWRMVAAVCLTFLAAYWVYEAFHLFASLRRSAVETDEPSSIDTPADQDDATEVV